MSKYRYAILGAGRQGTAAAYDLGRFGKAKKIHFIDMDPMSAQQSCSRINHLLGEEIATSTGLEISRADDLIELLTDIDVTLSAVPYHLNLPITKACIQAGSSMCDMGGHTKTVRLQLDLDEHAQAAGVSIVPDCGMGPGLNTTMAVHVMDQFDIPQEIYIYDGGLPQNPQPPWNYKLTFHINGLTNEMDGQALFIRDGKVTPVDTLSEPEVVTFEPVGKLEADVTSGGLSTSPWDFESQLQRYENKTLRYPGHFEWLRAYKTLGLFSEKPIHINGQKVTPRQLFHALLEPQIRDDLVEDICLIRVVGHGLIEGKKKAITLDLVDTKDEDTGFSAMERLTGWHCAMMMGFQARGMVAPGCHPVHSAISATTFMEAVRERGIKYYFRQE